MRSNRTETILTQRDSVVSMEVVRCRNCGIPIDALNRSSKHFCTVECKQEFIESSLA